MQEAKAAAPSQSFPLVDLSGLDVFVESAPITSSASPALAANSSSRPSEASPSQPPIPRTYNMQDLMIRWNCSRGFVGKQISRGLPMKKLSNGRWSIKENDLINWERFLEDERKKARRNSTIATIVGVLITIIVIALFAKGLPRYTHGTICPKLPESHAGVNHT